MFTLINFFGMSIVVRRSCLFIKILIVNYNRAVKINKIFPGHVMSHEYINNPIVGLMIGIQLRYNLLGHLLEINTLY